MPSLYAKFVLFISELCDTAQRYYNSVFYNSGKKNVGKYNKLSVN